MNLSSRLQRFRGTAKFGWVGAMVTLLIWAAHPALAQDASAWSTSHKSQARLLAGGGSGDMRLAALEFAMEQGFKTYWRHPGESGLPPSFDWSGSSNVERVEVLWPAPHRYEDASGVAYGYSGSLILPLKVTAKDAAQPVRLTGRVDYGVCRDICIPAHAELDLLLPTGGTAERPRIEAALAQVPIQVPVGAPGPLSVLGVQVEGPDRIQVRVRAPEGSEPVLFAEVPEGWYVDPSPRMTRSAPTQGEPSGTFTVSVLERPAEIAAAVPLRLTLVAGERAIDTVVDLPASALK